MRSSLPCRSEDTRDQARVMVVKQTGFMPMSHGAVASHLFTSCTLLPIAR